MTPHKIIRRLRECNTFLNLLIELVNEEYVNLIENNINKNNLLMSELWEEDEIE